MRGWIGDQSLPDWMQRKLASILIKHRMREFIQQINHTVNVLREEQREPSLRMIFDWMCALNYTKAYHKSNRDRDLYAFPNWCYFIVVLQYTTNISEFIKTTMWFHTPTDLCFPENDPLVNGCYKYDSIQYHLILDWSTEKFPWPIDLQLIVLVSSRLDQTQFLGLMRLGPITNKLRKIPTELDGHEQSISRIINKDASSQSQCSGEFCSHYEHEKSFHTGSHFGRQQSTTETKKQSIRFEISSLL